VIQPQIERFARAWRTRKADRHQEALDDVSEVVTLSIVILGGLAEPWNALDWAERCARTENELRGLDDRLRKAGYG
jgi:hypothetical protein